MIVDTIEKMKILTVWDGPVDFKLREYQRNLIEDIDSHNSILCIKGRQLGLTKLILAYVLVYAMTNPYSTCILKSWKFIVTKEQLKAALKMYESISDENKIGLVESSSSKIVFENGSKILAISSINDTKSMTINLAAFDEVVNEDELREFIEMHEPSMSLLKNSKIIVASSPYPQWKLHGYIHTMWKVYSACEKYFNVKAIKITYQDWPDADLNKIKYLKEIMSKEDFKRDILCEWECQKST